MKRRYQLILNLVLMAGVSGTPLVHGQVAVTGGQKQKPVTQTRPVTTVAVTETTAPQVVTILHRLNGLKMLGLLVRSDDKLLAITELDDAFKLMGEVHTNVIAGLAIDDGQTIVVRLPEVEAEFGSPSMAFAWPKGSWTKLWPALPPAPEIAVSRMNGELFASPDLTVVVRGGQRFSARYVGFDGVTGLSILKLENHVLPTVEAKPEAVRVGQRLRVVAPEPAGTTAVGRAVTVKVGQTPGTITKVTRAPSGGLARLKITSTGLSQANIGGVAINDFGETVGIIDNIEQGEASVLSALQIRNAARRVLAKQSSVPRPWLGVSGEPVATLTPSSLVNNGWQQPRAVALAQERQGIMLTAVAPDSPASSAALRPGDVILSVNGEDIRNADDFSWFLEQAGPGSDVTFTILHPGRTNSESVRIRLSGAFFPGLEANTLAPGASPFMKNLVQRHGIEAVQLMPGVAEGFGARRGLLVFSVEPKSQAFKAGLRPGDVIETIDGQNVSKLASIPETAVTFEVVRRRQRLTFNLESPPK